MNELAEIPNLTVREGELLSRHTRFGLGGPAAYFAETTNECAFMTAHRALLDADAHFTVIGGGTNLIVADQGYPGVVLRFVASSIHHQGTCVQVQSGAVLQDLVDYTVTHGLRGLQTMTGIPGLVGGAIYGNAGAYGHSIMEFVRRVRFFDGTLMREFSNAECGFEYRESVFKKHKDWIIFSADLELSEGDVAELTKAAADIRKIRDEKYPPTMKCAGSIFKNLFFARLPQAVQALVPEKVVREGKVPSAWFLEQVDAKGLKNGGIEVATYHANLIYNAGGGTARQVCEIIGELKSRVRARFGFDLEEEVQYVGF